MNKHLGTSIDSSIGWLLRSSPAEIKPIIERDQVALSLFANMVGSPVVGTKFEDNGDNTRSLGYFFQGCNVGGYTLRGMYDSLTPGMKQQVINSLGYNPLDVS